VKISHNVGFLKEKGGTLFLKAFVCATNMEKKPEKNPTSFYTYSKIFWFESSKVNIIYKIKVIGLHIQKVNF
jgi:hypothetical protein